MRTSVVGAGPGGLYFGLLMKKAFPETEVSVYERNRADDAFGWGVVFSDETLGNFEAAEPESFAEIRRRFASWTDIETFYRGECVRSTGHGFCGLSRKSLLQILQARCRALGVRMEFQKEIADLGALEKSDLVVAADGINSFVRTKYEAHFRPKIHWGKCRFSWLGTTKELRAFTFVFRENEHGLFQVHAYPFEKGLSTWIVECQKDTWKRAGLDRASEEQTVAYCEKLFAEDLQGHRLLTNRSLWRSFPTVSCERWVHRNVALLGDAAHTAHFSIGSGTKLAMEDSIALVEAFRKHGTKNVEAALASYEESRHLDVLKLQRAAKTSREWFENSRRYLGQEPLPFTFNLMTRSKRITYDNLKLRDPELVSRVDSWFAAKHGAPREASGKAPPPIFAPLRLRGLALHNRIVVSPMCQYSAEDGTVGEWHLVHLGSRAVGGAALVVAEMTNVSREGRITFGCAGIYKEEHVAAWRRVVDFVHAHTPAKIGLQLGHAGRKGSCNLPWEGDDPLRDGRAWTTIGPSAVPFDSDWPAPKEMDRADRRRVLAEYARAAEMAERAGFDMLEIHMAHGYLLSSFLSPAANFRRDECGGSLENRMRFPLEAFEAVRRAFPESKPIAVRISATDWLEEEGKGTTVEESVAFARALKQRGCDAVDVSSAGNTPESKVEYGRMYQVPFAEKIRYEAEIPVMAVGGILGADHANTILAAERADLCVMARPHLLDPYLTMRAAVSYGYGGHPWPKQYLPAKPKRGHP